MRSLSKIPVFHNIPIMVRAALNIPFIDGKPANVYRLRRAIPTLAYLKERGAKIIVVGHIGEKGTETLSPVAEELSHLISGVTFCKTMVGPVARKAVRELPPGGILVLENLRRNKGEVANDHAFSRELASLADVFVEDSFDTCHRVHASIVGVPTLLPSYAGLLVEEEVKELSKALKPRSPSLAIIGGAKFSTKEPVLDRLLKTYSKVFVGGALANDFLKAKGYPVGKSLVSNAPRESIERLLAHKKLLLPVDGRVMPASAISSTRAGMRVVPFSEVRSDEVILDHGPETTKLIANQIRKSKTVLWNGPLGEYERKFTDTTDAVAEAIVESKAYSVVGGGDTIAELERIGLLDRFSFASTGGGAMLEFLAKGTLPGISVLH